MARTTASTASTHSDTYESGSERGEGGWGCKDSKVTGWAGLAPKTTFLGPASFSLAKQLNVGGRGQDEGEVQTPSLDLPLYIIYTASKEYFFATVGRNFWKCKFHNRATDRKIIIHRSVLKKRLYVEFTAVHVAQNSFFEFTVSSPLSMYLGTKFLDSRRWPLNLQNRLKFGWGPLKLI